MHKKIGILGGGQLGRMLSVAASRLGLQTHIFEPQANCPAGDVSNFVTTAQYTDTRALEQFAKSVDVVTYEFENIPTEALDIIQEFAPIRPDRQALKISQDRLLEKVWLNDLGLDTAQYSVDMDKAYDIIGAPSILKTRRFGYDGKGQYKINHKQDFELAIEEVGDTPVILEGLINFKQEISIIGARNNHDEIKCYEPGENLHTNGILHTTTVPASLEERERRDAILIAHKILDRLKYVGVMGIELFVTDNGLVVNEIAPRVHNSGHWTQNGCAVDQFEQHIRAVCDWSLADCKRKNNIIMQNLIGDDIEKVDELSKMSNVAIHIYGKTEVKPGRKMGHFNKIVDVEV